MNMHIHNADDLLDDLISATREQFAEAELDAATARFRQTLPDREAQTNRATVRLPRWLKLSGAHRQVAADYYQVRKAVSDEALDGLVELLEHRDESLSWSARYALKNLAEHDEKVRARLSLIDDIRVQHYQLI